jgi:hypothetical protein
MAGIEKRTYLYEILFRFGPEGLAGAHAIDMEQLYDSDEDKVELERELPARPITLAEAKELIGVQKATVLVGAADAKARAAAANAEAGRAIEAAEAIETAAAEVVAAAERERDEATARLEQAIKALTGPTK